MYRYRINLTGKFVYVTCKQVLNVNNTAVLVDRLAENFEGSQLILSLTHQLVSSVS